MGFQVAYVPIGVGTFHLESAQDQFEKSVSMLRGLTADCAVPEKMLLTINDLDAYLDTISPDLIVLQNITFANAAYASEVLKRFDCPIVLWTLREPVIDGTRLRLNSLTGAYSAGNAITAFRGEGRFEYIFGAPTEEEVKAEIGAAIRAAKVKYDLRRLKMISIGHTPQGFGFGRALDAEMMSTFGTTLDSIEARELINKAKGYTEEELADELTEARRTIVGLDTIPEKNVVNFARLYKAYKSYVGENRIGALCSRCWPDFFTEFGTPVCSVLSLLNANGVSASCESDAYGALSMFIGSDLTGRSCFFGDPVSMNEQESTITFWHCGMAACDLARKDTGAQVGVQPQDRPGHGLWLRGLRVRHPLPGGPQARRQLPLLRCRGRCTGQAQAVQRHLGGRQDRSQRQRGGLRHRQGRLGAPLCSGVRTGRQRAGKTGQYAGRRGLQVLKIISKNKDRKP